jgi:hypothetical protein
VGLNIAREQNWRAPSVKEAHQSARHADAGAGDTAEKTGAARGSHEAEHKDSESRVEESPAGTKHEDNPKNPGGDEK